MSGQPFWLAPLDHTGDAGFTVTAPDLPDLFSRAAWGMFDLICEIEAVQSRDQVEVEVEAPDLGALMVRWLSELNYRHITGHMLFARFEIRQLSDHRLAALAGGERICPDRHTVYTEIKAVTFHGLKVGHDGDLWTAQVIFDL